MATSRTGRLRVVVMGVAGVGKSTVAAALATATGAGFLEGDSLHPLANVEKMRRGEPLCDADRLPWLDAVGAALAAAPRVVATCSALRRLYRDRLRAAALDLVFVHLSASPALVESRLQRRSGHYMPPSLLSSQLDTLEPLEPDERGFTLDASQPVDAIVAAIVARL